MLDRLADLQASPVLTLFGLSGSWLLAACGGGSGAPNNPYVTPVPTTPTLHGATRGADGLFGRSGHTVTITAGVAPVLCVQLQRHGAHRSARSVAGNTIVLLPEQGHCGHRCRR